MWYSTSQSHTQIDELESNRANDLVQYTVSLDSVYESTSRPAGFQLSTNNPYSPKSWDWLTNLSFIENRF